MSLQFLKADSADAVALAGLVQFPLAETPLKLSGRTK